MHAQYAVRDTGVQEEGIKKSEALIALEGKIRASVPTSVPVTGEYTSGQEYKGYEIILQLIVKPRSMRENRGFEPTSVTEYAS